MFLKPDGLLQVSPMEMPFLVPLSRRLPSLPLPKSYLARFLSSAT